MAQLVVRITDETGSTTEVVGGNGIKNAKTSAQIKSPEAKESKQGMISLSVAAMAVQQTASYVTSNVGKWTGNKQNQTAMNNLMQLGGLGVVAYTNPYAAAAMVAVQLGTTAIDYHFEKVWNDRRESNSLARAGYSSKGELLGRKR